MNGCCYHILPRIAAAAVQVVDLLSLAELSHLVVVVVELASYCEQVQIDADCDVGHCLCSGRNLRMGHTREVLCPPYWWSDDDDGVREERRSRTPKDVQQHASASLFSADLTESHHISKAQQAYTNHVSIIKSCSRLKSQLLQAVRSFPGLRYSHAKQGQLADDDGHMMTFKQSTAGRISSRQVIPSPSIRQRSIR